MRGKTFLDHRMNTKLKKASYSGFQQKKSYIQKLTRNNKIQWSHKKEKINSCQEVQMDPVTDKRQSVFHITKLYL